MPDIIGTNDADILSGTSGSDSIYGLAGNDILIGGSGADVSDGGTGDDWHFVDGGSDVVLEAAGEGNDRVFAGASFALAAAAEVETLSTDFHDGTAAIDLTGSNSANLIYGNAGANVLSGGGGGDTLVGRAGNDILIGGSGADVSDGGTGDDWYFVDGGSDVVLEAAGEGNDRVFAGASFALAAAAEVETLSTDFHDGTAAIDLTGSNSANLIYGNAGANVLSGGGGGDTLVGRAGNDILIGGSGADVSDGGTGDDWYFVDGGSDVVLEAAGEGNDRVFAGASFALAAAAEVETLSTDFHDGTAAIDLTGSNSANLIYGNAGANVLSGGGGGDTLVGRAGNDILIGGSGADVSDGGTGDDWYFVDGGSDVVLEAAGEGNDRVFAGASFALAAAAEVETLSTDFHDGTAAIDLTGSNSANLIYGNAGANVLSGGGGGDTLVGRAGNDILIGGSGADVSDGGTGDDWYFVDGGSDVVLEAAGEGNDRVFAGASFALAAAAEVETLSTDFHDGTAAIDLTGSNSANLIYGNNGANVLNGGVGNDLLQGRGGADVFAFTTALGGSNIDTIADFSVVDDIIRLGGFTGEPFGALASGALAAGAFAIGQAAQQADDVIIYNSGTGALYYDLDGSGAGAAVQFATLSPSLALTAAAFTISGSPNQAPIFTSPAAVTVVENSPAGTIVYQAAATDPDGDRFVYSLGGVDAGLFSIDVAGVLRILVSPDFEARASYSFLVIASDSGTSSVRAVSLTVGDVNESTPALPETTGANDSIGGAQAINRGALAVSVNPNLPNDDLPSITIQGSVSSTSDKDFFAISLAAGELLILDVDNSGGLLDSMVRAFNSSGVEVASNDDLVSLDPGSPPHPEYGHNTDSFVRFRATSAGTYYFSIESLQDPQNPTFGSYELNVSVGPPATPAQILDEDIDALISGDEWATKALAYAFPTSVSQYPADIDETSPASDFAPFTITQQQATTQLLQLIANVSELSFQLAANPANAHLKFAMSSEADSAYAYYPPFGNPTPGSSLAGTAWFNKVDFNNPIKGNYAWAAILHETGHTLGLKHGHDSPAVSSRTGFAGIYGDELPFLFRRRCGPGRRLQQRNLGLSTDADDARHCGTTAGVRRQFQLQRDGHDLSLERDDRRVLRQRRRSGRPRGQSHFHDALGRRRNGYI